jgi:hypothetical protein
MRTHPIKIFLSLVCLEGWITFGILLGTPSMERNDWILGYSFPRFLIVLFAFICSSASLFVEIKTWLRPDWFQSILHRLDTFYEEKENLALMLISNFTAVILLFAVILAGFLPFFSSAGLFKTIVKNLFPLLAWLWLFLLQWAAVLGFCYHSKITRSGYWQKNSAMIFKKLLTAPLGIWIVVFCILLSAAMLYAFSPAHAGRVPGHDSGIFLYFGKRINAGDIPFLNLWDHKPPLVFYIDALGLQLAGGSVWGVWGLELLSLAISTLLCFLLLRYTANLTVTLFVLISMILNLPLLLEGGNLTEEFALPLIFGAMIIFLFSIKNHKPRLHGFLLGVFLSLAIMLKQTTIGVWIAIFGLWVLEFLWMKQTPPWRLILWMLVGFCTATIPWLIYFGANHALGDFWSVAYAFNFLYSDIAPKERGEAIGEIFTFLATASPFFAATFVAWLFVLLSLVRKGIRDLPVLILISFIDFPLEILLISLSGKNYHHYLLTMLPGATLLTGYLCTTLLQWTVSKKALTLAYGLYPVLLAAMIIAGTSKTIDAYYQPEEIPITKAVEYIREQTTEKDTVVMWGSQTVVNFLSGRNAPSRFVHQKPLFRPGYATPQIAAEFLQDLTTRRPRLIVNTHLPSTPFIHIDNAGNCAIPTGIPDGMPEVFQYICTHYRFSDVLKYDNWEIYTLRDEP